MNKTMIHNNNNNNHNNNNDKPALQNSVVLHALPHLVFSSVLSFHYPFLFLNLFQFVFGVIILLCFFSVFFLCF